jgi:hypothetical protein
VLEREREREREDLTREERRCRTCSAEKPSSLWPTTATVDDIVHVT